MKEYTNKKPPLGLTPRDFWLRDRIDECIESLKRQQLNEDWDIYRRKSKLFAEEILYVVAEWEKYHK